MISSIFRQIPAVFGIVFFTSGMVIESALAIDFEHEKVLDSVTGKSIDINDIVVNDIMPPLTPEERSKLETGNKNKAVMPASAARSLPPESPANLRTANARKAANGALMKDQRVSRAIFSSEILNREPTDNLRTIHDGSQRIYFFSEFNGMRGKKALHKWTLNGKPILEKKFSINGKRWRAWSSKDISQYKPGTWQVTVSTDNGELLAEHHLSVSNVEAAGLSEQ